MNYRPDGANVHDAWYFNIGDQTHCIHMQVTDPERPEDTRQYCSLGHAVSDDLIVWRTLPTILHGGRGDAYDSGRVHTGSVIQHDNLYYMFYTVTRGDGKWINRIALATSPDGLNWTKHPDNPIINPDPRWYCDEHHRSRPQNHSIWVDCRDPLVIRDPDGAGFWCFYVARRPADTNTESAVIALCHSNDLLHWEHQAPCFAPDRYACMEVPEVFQMQGKWYMTVTTGNGYGQRNVVDDPNHTRDTVYAVADRIQGPYREPDDNILMGSMGFNGYTCRFIEKDGELCFLNPHRDYLAIPKVVRMDSKGRLRPYYYKGLDHYRGKTLIRSLDDASQPNDGRWGSIGTWRVNDRAMIGACEKDWALHVYDSADGDFFYEADVCIRDARSAGLAFRLQGETIRDGGYVFLLDAAAHEVALTRALNFITVDKSVFPVERNRTYHIQCLADGPFFNVFIDDVLVIQTHDETFQTGRFGLFVEKGTATFAHVRVNKTIEPKSGSFITTAGIMPR